MALGFGLSSPKSLVRGWITWLCLVQTPEPTEKKAEYRLLDKNTIWSQEDPGKSAFWFSILMPLMPFYYVSEPKHWSADNAGASPYLHSNHPGPYWKRSCYVFNACSKLKRTWSWNVVSHLSVALSSLFWQIVYLYMLHRAIHCEFISKWQKFHQSQDLHVTLLHPAFNKWIEGAKALWKEQRILSRSPKTKREEQQLPSASAVCFGRNFLSWAGLKTDKDRKKYP